MPKATTNAPAMTFRADVHDIIAGLLTGREDIRAGQMMGLKLPQTRISQLLSERPLEVAPFTPGRGTMSGWVQINHEELEMFESDADMLDEALAFVQAQPKKGRRPCARTDREQHHDPGDY
jgi:hypothetical protein